MGFSQNKSLVYNRRMCFSWSCYAFNKKYSHSKGKVQWGQALVVWNYVYKAEWFLSNRNVHQVTKISYLDIICGNFSKSC